MIGAPSFEQWRSAGKHVSYRQQPVFVVEHGSPGRGETLVCIHGFPTASWDWHAIWPALCRRFGYVIAPDLMGHGWSAKPLRWEYSMFDQADLIQTLLTERGVQRCHILGHDYGDSVAQELLARHVERHERNKLPAPTFIHPAIQNGRQEPARMPFIESVCLLNGGLFPEAHRRRLVQKLLLSPFGAVFSRLTWEGRFGASLSAIFGPNTKPNAQQIREFWRLVKHDDGHHLNHRLIQYVPERVANRERWVSAMQKTRARLRFINGAADPVSGAHMAERYRELIPHPDVVLLPGIGHYPQIEAPQAVIDAITAFHQHLENVRGL
jgi:pimeloyl-ACP methyl ester carboxylesterase